jgi:hypothetical protein
MRPLLALRLAACLSVFAPMPASADTFDGSLPLLCALKGASECTPADGCRSIQPEDVGAPDFFMIDVASQSVQGLGVEGRRSAIRSTAAIDEKLILQGAEDGIDGVRDGLGWTVAIDQVTGRMVLTAAGEGVAFVVFGVCAALASTAQAPR